MKKTDKQEIIDDHCHCFAGIDQSERVVSGLDELRNAGVRHMAVMGLVNPSLDEQDAWK